MQQSNYNIYYENNSLLYNSYSQCLLQISPQIYDILNNGDLSQLSEDIYDLFLEKKIITESYEYERQKLDTEINKATKSHKIITLVISLTSLCNLNCWYCIQNPRKDIEKKNLLNSDKWKNIKDVLVNDIINNETENISVVLYGGEPMMNKLMLNQIITELNDVCGNNIKANYTLITNGTLLDNSESIIQLVDKIQITIDTTEEVHNYNRPFINGGKSFNKIYESLKKYSSLFPDKFNLRMNISTENKDDAKKLLLELKKDGLNKTLKYIVFCPIIDNENKSCRKYDEKNEILLLELYRFALKHGFKITQNITNGLCSAYNDSTLCVDENLNLYLCIGFLYETIIGNISDSKLKINKPYINKECAIDDKCKFYPICLGGSPCGITCPKEYYEKFFPKYLMLKYGVPSLQNEEEQND